MPDQLDLPDQTILEYWYEISADILRNNIADWSNWIEWYRVVNVLPEPAGLVYNCLVLNFQVENGGLQQYFDNGYGMFVYKAIEYLALIGANDLSAIVAAAAKAVNPHELRDDRFVQYIGEGAYENVGNVTLQLTGFTDRYYASADRKNIQSLISDYVRRVPGVSY